MLPGLWKTSWTTKRSSKCKYLRCRRKFGRRTIIKSVFDYRFNSNMHTHMFLFVTQAFWDFIVFLCAIWLDFKSLNGNPAYDCWTQTSWQLMQRDSGTADSGIRYVYFYPVWKEAWANLLQCFHKFEKSIVSVRLWSTCSCEYLNQKTVIQASFHTV